jgi:pyrroloquinoline quinone biosynthesis protein B
VLGLLSLRESHPLIVYATDAVRRGFTEGNGLYRTLQRFPGQVTWRRLALGVEVPLGGRDGRDRGDAEGAGDGAGAPGGLTVTPFAVPGKRPIHLELGATLPPSDEDNIGLLISAPGAGGVARTLAYVPAVAAWTDDIQRRVSQADAVFFDGTFWSSAELSTTGVGTKRAEDMAHLPLAGPDGGLARLAAVTTSRRVLIHINNTNPILRDDSPERRQVEASGVEVAFDGMEVTL